jgi:signal transduction histidine kinase
MRYSLRTRLTLSFLVAIVATAGLVMLLANLITANQFRGLVSLAGQRYAQRLAPAFADYYATAGGWNGVEELMAYVQDTDRQPLPSHAPMPKHVMPTSGMMNPGDERLLLVDAEGHAIADSMPEASLPKDLASNLNKGASIVVDEKQVGILIVYSALGELSSSQTDFLRQINTLMLIAGGVAVLGVLIVGSIQARRIVKPVRALAAAAHRVADGDFSQRIPVTRKDELGEMATAFNTMASELEQQHELRHRAMADIAHELRTPLSVLQVQLESIQDNLTEPTPEVIAGLQDDLTHLSHLVEDLRVLTLADAGELQVEAEPVEMGELTRSVVKRLQTTAQATDVTLDARLPDTSLHALGDAQRLTQVLLNLLTNALQHTPSGGKITASAHAGEGKVHITVQDSGEGIAPEDLPHIFERFYRADRARSRDTGGSGLGLSIAKSLVEAQGGTISVESQAGQGSTFTVSLPQAAIKD